MCSNSIVLINKIKNDLIGLLTLFVRRMGLETSLEAFRGVNTCLTLYKDLSILPNTRRADPESAFGVLFLQL